MSNISARQMYRDFFGVEPNHLFLQVMEKYAESKNKELQQEVERLTSVLRYCQSKAYIIVNTKNAINHQYVKRDAEKMKAEIDKALFSH